MQLQIQYSVCCYVRKLLASKNHKKLKEIEKNKFFIIIIHSNKVTTNLFNILAIKIHELRDDNIK